MLHFRIRSALAYFPDHHLDNFQPICIHFHLAQHLGMFSKAFNQLKPISSLMEILNKCSWLCREKWQIYLFPMNISQGCYIKEAVSGRYTSDLQLPLIVYGWKSLELALLWWKLPYGSSQMIWFSQFLLITGAPLWKTSLFDRTCRAKPLIYLSNGMRREFLRCLHLLY